MQPNPPYIIEKSQPSDAGLERMMQADSWRATYVSPENGVSEEWVKSYTDEWFSNEKMALSRQYLQTVYDDKNQLRLTAKLNGEVVGFIHCQRHDDGTAELAGLYTDPSTFGTGLGAQLMEPAMEWMGDGKLWLEVVAYNYRAIRFYEKYGFKFKPGSESLYQDKMPTIKMVRGSQESTDE